MQVDPDDEHGRQDHAGGETSTSPRRLEDGHQHERAQKRHEVRTDVQVRAADGHGGDGGDRGGDERGAPPPPDPGGEREGEAHGDDLDDRDPRGPPSAAKMPYVTTCHSHSWFCQGAPSAVYEKTSCDGMARCSTMWRPTARCHHRSPAVTLLSDAYEAAAATVARSSVAAT
jgi:hypothetical protein